MSDSVPAPTTNQMPAKLPLHLSTTKHHSAKLKNTAHLPEEVKLIEIEQSDEENVIKSDKMEKKILELYTKHYSLRGSKHPQPAKLPDLPSPQTSTTQKMSPETTETIAEEKYTYQEYLDSNENFNPF